MADREVNGYNKIMYFTPNFNFFLSHSPSRIVWRLWSLWWWRSSRKMGFSCFSGDCDPFYGFGWWFKVLAIDGLCSVLENLGRLWLWSLYCFRRMGKWEGTVTSLSPFIFDPTEYWIPHPWAWIGFSISVQQKTPWIVKPIIPYIFHWIYHNFVIWKEYISKLGIFIKKLINQCGPLRSYFCSVCVERSLSKWGIWLFSSSTSCSRNCGWTFPIHFFPFYSSRSDLSALRLRWWTGYVREKERERQRRW